MDAVNWLARKGESENKNILSINSTPMKFILIFYRIYQNEQVEKWEWPVMMMNFREREWYESQSVCQANDVLLSDVYDC